MTEEQKQKRREASQRYRDRKRAERLGEPVPDTLYVMNRTDEEKRAYKNELDRKLRADKTSEEREQYLASERERKRKKNQIGFIYGLVCPIQNRIRYVGQTRAKSLVTRCSEHNRESTLARAHCNAKNTWIRQVGRVSIVLLEKVLVDSINDRERFWIALLPDLLNANAGSSKNCGMSIEARKRISESRMGDKNPMYGKRVIVTPENALKISVALKNSEKFQASRKSAEYRQKIAEVQWKNIWCLLNKDTFEIVAEFNSAIQIIEYFKKTHNITYTVGNFHNSRRDKREIRRGIDKKYWVVYKQDIEDFIKEKRDVFN